LPIVENNICHPRIVKDARCFPTVFKGDAVDDHSVESLITLKVIPTKEITWSSASYQASVCYAIVPYTCHRIQGAFVDERNLDQAEAGEWEFAAWPEYDALDAGHGLSRQGGNGGKLLQAGELGASLIAAMESEGRPTFKDRLEEAGLGRPGSDRARTLLQLGRETLEWLEGNNVGLVYLDDGEWKLTD